MKLVDALPQFDTRLLGFSEGRRELTKYDPLLFAAVYMPHKLIMQGATEPTLNQFHLDIIEYAKSWTKPLGKAREHRDCFIAPRQCGKSTWIFHILPIWAAAHGHKKYILAFSDSETQAQGWLLNFKTEVESNPLLKEDFPDLVAVDKTGSAGRALMDNRNATKRANGFVFQAKGADSAVLGANIDGMRPEVILFDDIEPSESNYGVTDMKKRKATLLQSHFYLNTFAIVAFVGTTTMTNSIIDQLRKVGEAEREYEGAPDLFRDTLDDEFKWVVDENIKTHYYPAIEEGPEGEEESLWPEVWPMEELNKTRHTRSFAMNMMNKPISGEEGYWQEEDIDIDRTEYGKTIISVDPAVTTAKSSDYSAIAVISRARDGKFFVRYAQQFKVDPSSLAEKVQELVTRFNAGLVLVEVNQGHDLWKQSFSKVKTRVKLIKQKAPKPVRIGQSAELYKKGMVFHSEHFPLLEEQMLAYPHVSHDDLVDAVATGLIFFGSKKRGPATAIQRNYLED
jgi:predicted phage terminase large subunit-like protein